MGCVRQSGGLLEAVADPTATEVVGRELHADTIARQDAYEVHAQLAADVCQDLVAVLELEFSTSFGALRTQQGSPSKALGTLCVELIITAPG